jgi:diguanylate cyclase (GGDEF)-like protein
MDAPYILIGYAVALILVFVGFGVIRRSIPELRGVHQLSLFVLCGIAAVFLLAARGRAPEILTLVVANTLLLFGPLFLYAAAGEILGVRAGGVRWLTALSLAGSAFMYWFSIERPNIRMRLLTHGIVIGAIFAATAVLLFRDRNDSPDVAVRASAWLAGTMAVLELAWCSYPWIFRVEPNFQHPDAVGTAFSYLATLLALAAVAALVWLSLCVQRVDLQRMAQTDSLTGLLNRGAFEAVLRRDLQRCHRSGATLAVMLIDLDYFKQINDSFGHAVGDSALRRISAALSAGIRPSDVLARYGGEEFVILLRESGVVDAHAAAERIRFDIQRLEDLPEGVTLTASIGVAVNLPGESPDELILRADEALYRSKREGRNLVTLYRSPRQDKVASA